MTKQLLLVGHISLYLEFVKLSQYQNDTLLLFIAKGYQPRTLSLFPAPQIQSHLQSHILSIAMIFFCDHFSPFSPATFHPISLFKALQLLHITTLLSSSLNEEDLHLYISFHIIPGASEVHLTRDHHCNVIHFRRLERR